MRMYERNGRGSIPHFGAVEENGGGWVPELKRIKQGLNEMLLSMEIAGFSGRGQ